MQLKYWFIKYIEW